MIPKLELSPYPDDPASRAELVAFLEEHWRLDGEPGWERRMRHWWDENPMAAENGERGQWVRTEGRVVCYGGSIPAAYAWQGRQLPAFNATTLCVDARFPKAAATLFLHQRELMKRLVITHSTPNPRVQDALLKLNARAGKMVTRHYLPAGAVALLSGRSWWPSFPDGRRLTTHPEEVTAIMRPFQRADRVEKWITPDYLRWFCNSPVRKHHFLGAVDAGGVLSSFLLVTRRMIKGLRSWDVLEAFTTGDDKTELQALMGLLVRQPGLLPGGATLVTAATFPGDHAWDGTPAWLRRQQDACHFFLLPESLRSAPKHTVMAEGDLGL
ncbi:MAG: hypothetical protein JNM65_15425 [Verrucomicrobiaceae bacterium]|nr:hypothetical protein [Verrucomicrobiaceae bacterium]